MTWQQMVFIATIFRNVASQPCGIDTYSIYQKMLKDHTYMTFKARPGSLDCRQTCISDVICQSYNYVVSRDICELNNRTKEARPEDFVNDNDRYYMRKTPKRGIKNVTSSAVSSWFFGQWFYHWKGNSSKHNKNILVNTFTMWINWFQCLSVPSPSCPLIRVKKSKQAKEDLHSAAVTG